MKKNVKVYDKRILFCFLLFRKCLQKNILTENLGYVIFSKQPNWAFFLCLKVRWKVYWRSATREIGGGYCARKNHIGMY